MGIEIRCGWCNRFLVELETQPNGRVRVHCHECGVSTTIEPRAPLLDNWRGHTRKL